MDGQPTGNVFVEAKQRLHIRFAKEENIVLSRYKFYTQQQQENETINEFVTNLRELSLKCKFGQMTEELIRDQLIVHCKCKKTQERLWAAKNPTLKEAIDIAKVIEQSQSCMKIMEHKDLQQVSSVTPQAQPDEVEVVNRSIVRRSKKPFTNAPTNNTRTCFRCGSRSHDAQSRSCPATDKTCWKCSRRGHFGAVCKNPGKPRVASVNEDGFDVDNSYRDRVLCVYDVCGVGNRLSRPMAEFDVDNQKVSLMLDSGSMFTIIPVSIFKDLWPSVELKPKDIDPCGYQGQTIELLGMMKSARISYKGRHTIGNVYMAVDGSTILGWIHQYDLNIINPRGPEVVMVVDNLSVEEIVKEAKEVFFRQIR